MTREVLSDIDAMDDVERAEMVAAWWVGIIADGWVSMWDAAFVTATGLLAGYKGEAKPEPTPTLDLWEAGWLAREMVLSLHESAVPST